MKTFQHSSGSAIFFGSRLLTTSREARVAALIAGWIISGTGLMAQTVPFLNLADGPFSPGGFNRIDSATVTTFFDSRNGTLTIEVDPATPQVVDILNATNAHSDLQFQVNFSFLNVNNGIPVDFFGRAYNFLNGGPWAQYQSGHFDFAVSMSGASNIIPVLDIGSDIYSKSVRFWLNTQGNITGGNYYPNGVPKPPTPTTPPSSVPQNPSTGKPYASNINPSKPLNTNVYQASGLSDHVANNNLTSNYDFNHILSVVALLPTAEQTESSFHRVIAEPYASMSSVALESMDRFRQSALAGFGTGKLPHLRVVKTPSPEAKSAIIEENECTPWSIFTDVSHTQANLDGTSNGLSDFNYSILQNILGVEYALTPTVTIGTVFGYGYSSLYNFEHANADINSNNYSAALCGVYRPGNFAFTGLLGYTRFSYQSTRQIHFGTEQAGYVNRSASADWFANGLTCAGEASYTWALGPVNVVSEALLAYAGQSQSAFTESGANSLNLHLNSSNVNSIISGLGVSAEAPLKLTRTILITPRIRVAWEHDFLGDDSHDHQLQATFANVPDPGTLTVLGQNRGSDQINLSAALELSLNDRWSFFGGSEWANWSNGTETTYGGGLRYTW